MRQVQDALRPTGISAFAGAWKPTVEHPEAPERYIVYTTMRTEDEHWDDAYRNYRVYVYLNLWIMDDPTESARAIREAMHAAGFSMSDERDSYNADTRQTLIAWTWVGSLEAD